MKTREWNRKEIEYPQMSIRHNRKLVRRGEVAKKGGMTSIVFEIRKGTAFIGVAHCWKLDTYNKVKGRSIALGRLLYSFDKFSQEDFQIISKWIFKRVGKIDRKFMWDAYHGKPIE